MAQFSLGVQREVTPSVIWVVQYVGNVAWHQNTGTNINNLNPNVGVCECRQRYTSLLRRSFGTLP